MNIALVSHTYPTEQDPSRGIFISKEAHLIRSFAEVEVFIPSVHAKLFTTQNSRSQDPITDSISIHQLKYFSFPRKIFPRVIQKSLSNKLLQALNSTNSDIIHLHSLYPSGLAAPALKKVNYPVVITIHGGDWFYNINNNKLMEILKESLLISDAIITVGKKLKTEIASYLPGIKKKIHHVPHGIDVNKFEPAENISKLKKEFNWHQSKYNILSVANLYRVKGIHLLVQAFAKQKYSHISHLHIVSPRVDPNVKQEVDYLIDNLKIADRVTFYPSMPEKELIPYFQAADLFVSPSIKEGFGLAVAEATACGVPVLATRSGGPEEVVTEAIGHLVEANNVDALTEGIEFMLPRLDEFNQHQLNSFIGKSFSLSQKKEKLADIYQNILK